ncbi:MAG: ABC transporter ATP-binding protein/permease [Defluviitaleaceae bacterium]|nr:ABC transporter ATP-binding protein/permease [Defluviitaleaceae bacterium]
MKTFFYTLRKNQIRFGGFSLFYLLLAAAVAATSVISFYYMGMLGETAGDGNMDGLVSLLLTVSAIMGIQAVCAMIAAFTLGRFSGKVGHNFRRNFVKYFLHVPFKKFEQTNSGENLSVFSNDVPGAARFVTTGGLQMAGSIFSLVASFILLWSINTTFTLIFFGSFPVLMFLQIIVSMPIQKRTVQTSKATAEFNAVVNDSLQNVSTIAAYGLEEVLEKRYLGKYNIFFKLLKGRVALSLPLIAFGILASLAPVLVVAVLAANQVIAGYMYIGEYIAFLTVSMMAGEWLMMLAQNLQMLQMEAANAKRFNGTTAGAIGAAASGSRPNAGEISFQNVNFAYGEEEDAPLALTDVSFDIPQGARVAFVGGSGSGKSTVLKLLLGLYEPNSGMVSVGGQAMSYVPQDSFMFPESIARNIACSDTPDMEKLTKVCADAGILEFINSLPNKFDTILTESAENVSGGQRQRIALARAFYKDAPLILFDEATSALDPTTEAQVLESFDKLAKGKTVIMVAHRSRAIETCDTVITMEGGKIVDVANKGGRKS